jgi:hypothetical protein
MDFETKLMIIILLVFLITLRTIVDISYSVNYSIYSSESAEKFDHVYDNYMFVKSILDVPFILLTIFILFNIKFNLRVYSFLFLGIITILVDHFFEYLYVSLDANLTYFMEKYFTLIADSIILVIGIFILYKIFIVSK